MALGASAGQMQGLVLREGTALVAVGSALGDSGAFAPARLFAVDSDVLARNFDHFDNNPLLLAGAPLVLAGLAMLACYLPARAGNGDRSCDGAARGVISSISGVSRLCSLSP